MEMSKMEIEQLFEACDADGRGYLTLNEFEKIGEEMNLSSPDVRKVFMSMDANSDGRIEQSEFVNSFHTFTMALSPVDNDVENHMTDNADDVDSLVEDSYNRNNNNGVVTRETNIPSSDTVMTDGILTSTPRNSFERNGDRLFKHHRKSVRKSMDVTVMNSEQEYMYNQGSWENFAESIGEVIYALPGYDGISQLYRSLEIAGDGVLLQNFETIVQGMVKEIIRLQSGISNLEASLEKVTEKSTAQISMLEEEMESQIAQKEQKVREEEKKKAEEDTQILSEQYERQIEQLQSAIEKLKQMDEKLSAASPFEREIETLREKNRKLLQENSELKSKLTEVETEKMLLRGNMAAMEVDHQEKALEYVRESNEVCAVLDEQDMMSKQVESLYTNNRKLLDSNDSLREALESSLTKYKRISSAHQRNSNTMPIEYLTTHYRPDYIGSGRSSRASIYDNEALAECDPGKRTPDYNGRGDGHPYPTELDSGVGTYRDECDDSETDWADESNGFKRTASARYRNRRSIHRHSSSVSKRSNMSEGSRWSRSHRGRNSPTDYNDISDEDDHDVIHESDVSDEELRNLSSSPSSSRSKRVRRATSMRKVITPDVTLGHNKRMYKIVLCGDAGVGKTSFIHRLCRNEFTKYTKSTLGVDFQIKTIPIEHGRSVSLQLWDTAGQERFRSISASYFRRAEGVLLLYDCTSQQSFINVRDWMETISSSIDADSPVMICGNKLDMREEREIAQRPVVTAQEGAQLAATYGVLFVETSSLDGTNIFNAVSMLARHIKLDESADDTESVKSLENMSDSQTCCKQT